MNFISGVLCLLWGLIIIVSNIISCSKEKKIELKNFANFMYGFVYGIFPFVCIFRYESGIENASNELEYLGLDNVITILIISIIGYVFLNLGESVKFYKTRTNVIYDVETVYRGGIWITVLGWLSLLLWTNAAGGIFEFIIHADGIRAGYYKYSNPFAFMEHITRILQFSAAILVPMLVVRIRKITLLQIFFTIFSFVGAVLFIVCWSSRATFGFLFLIIILVVAEYYVAAGKRTFFSEYKRLILFLVVALVLMISMDSIVDFALGESSSTTISFNVLNILENEFKFIFRAQGNAISMLFKDNRDYLFSNDLINSLVAWLPERIVPFEIPETVWTYNTIMYCGTTLHGTSPTDLISCGMMEMGILGIALIPFLFGVIVSKLDSWVSGYDGEYNFYGSVVKCILATLIINGVSHFQFSSLVEALFFVILGHIIVSFGGRIKFKG